MLKNSALSLFKDFEIPDHLLSLSQTVEDEMRETEMTMNDLASRNFLKGLKAFSDVGISESHLQASRGYGYFDAGREALERLFARIFGAEEALVRPQLISGTHAIRCALFGLLRPGDEVLVVPEIPYDTLQPLFGLRKASGSLSEWGVQVRGVSAQDCLSGKIQMGEKTRVLFVQRSKGYAWRESISISVLTKLVQWAKSVNPGIYVAVDNCYGEFVEDQEPCDIGADLAAGSLIKNPGGGLAPTGGYVAGTSEAVEKAAAALTAPGLGKEVGPTLGLMRDFLTGIYLAPLFVGEALKTANYASGLFKALGYAVLPEPDAPRTDIIQAIQLGSREKVLAFARGLQRAGPLDSHAIPQPFPMAGYADPVVMAGGTFVQGGSLELSCDAPLREPFRVYVQGGLSFLHGKLGLLLAAREVMKNAFSI